MRVSYRLQALLVLGLGAYLPGCATGTLPASTAAVTEAAEAAWSEQPMATGRSRFVFSGWEGPALPVWAYVPANADRANAPIMVLMHGAKRDPRRYLEEWIDEADEQGFVVIAPEFAKGDFPRSRQYNRGALFDKAGASLNSEATWSFSAIEPLFDMVTAGLGSNQTVYTLYGHSAGSQFVHRFLFLKPDARVKRFLPANAGWYTFPDLQIDYPYGLAGVPVSEAGLKAALAKDVVLLLGDQDIDTGHSSLNRSEGAMAQGEHRFARGKNFHTAAKELAAQKGWEFNWSIRVIPGVAHSNGGIAAGSYDLVE